MKESIFLGSIMERGILGVRLRWFVFRIIQVGIRGRRIT